MKNFVFISPNFPLTYWKFCKELKNNGMRVLGIGDCPYDNLQQELRDALHEYYKVDSLENYDEVFRAVAFFTYKYGKIDWLESNNEYWLERDAKLRTEFNITTGFKEADMHKVKHKSAMKAFYKKAGIPTARYHIVKGYKDAAAFIKKVGYPVVVKPDNGVGAISTYRLTNDEELRNFIDTKDKSTEICPRLAFGLFALLNSTIYDRYISIVSKSKQINSKEMRTLPLPPRNIIENIGMRLMAVRQTSVAACDQIVNPTLHIIEK